MQHLPRKLSYLEGIYVDGAASIAYRKNPVKTAWQELSKMSPEFFGIFTDFFLCQEVTTSPDLVSCV